MEIHRFATKLHLREPSFQGEGSRLLQQDVPFAVGGVHRVCNMMISFFLSRKGFGADLIRAPILALALDFEARAGGAVVVGPRACAAGNVVRLDGQGIDCPRLNQTGGSGRSSDGQKCNNLKGCGGSHFSNVAKKIGKKKKIGNGNPFLFGKKQAADIDSKDCAIWIASKVCS